MNWLKHRTVLGVGCILFSLILCLGIAPLLSKNVSETIAIVRMTEDVSKGNLISAAHLETIEVGAYNLPTDVVKASEQAAGQYATVDLKAGDYLLPSKLSLPFLWMPISPVWMDRNKPYRSRSKVLQPDFPASCNQGILLASLLLTMEICARRGCPRSCTTWKCSR